MHILRRPRVRAALAATAATAALALSAAGAATSAEARSDRADQPDFEEIDSYLQEVMDDMNMPGAAVAIVKGDEVVHVKGFGQADDSGTEATEDTPFMIGSTSKSFTALSVMQLVEQGKVDLSAPVKRYLPWFRLADPKDSDRITVRHLLNQVSGIPTAAGMWWAYEEDTSDDALEEVVRRADDVELTHSPGETWQYSNLNYTTLGLLVQEVSGQSYEEYVEDHILAPLQMRHTYMFLSEAEDHGLATGHQFWFGRPFEGGGLANNRATTPTGLISSTANDMANYMLAHLNNGRYQDARVLSPGGMDTLHEGVAEIADDATYAMGWIDGEMKGVPVLMHNGDTGDFHTTMVLEPENGWGVIVMTNGSNDLRQSILDIPAYGVLSRLIGTDPPSTPGPLEDPVMVAVLAMLTAFVLQLFAIIRSVGLLRRWRRGVRRPRSRLVAVARVGAPILVSALWAIVALVVVPSVFGLPHGELVMFDIGWALLISGGLAVIWGVVARPVLAIRALRHEAATSISRSVRHEASARV